MTAAETMRAARAAAATAANSQNPAADVASFSADAVDRVVASFEGAAGAADAGFSFDAFAAKDDDVEREDERADDDAGVSYEDDDVVDVESTSVPFDEWVGRPPPARDDVARPPPTNPTRIRGDA